MNERDAGWPIEQLIQALTSQLDRAQAALAVKVRLGFPLTFAVKDLSIDLRAHVDMVDSTVRIRPAGPGDAEASVLHLQLTTITRPMIEENTVQLSTEHDEPSLKEVLGKDITDEEQRRLEWAGIHSASQLRELQRTVPEQAIQRVTQLPVERLRRALERASQPIISHVLPDRLGSDGDQAAAPLLRIRGFNLMEDEHPDVRIGGEQVPVLEANHRELLVAPLAHQLSGTIVVQTRPGAVTYKEFNVRPPRPPAEAPQNGGSDAA